MLTRRNYSPSIVCLLALVASATASAAELPVGIVADPPADGPVIKVDGGYMVDYTATIPGSDVEFEMVAIPGGTFKIGSPEDEKDRGGDEGPQVEIRVPPFWMGKHEVTWGEYLQFMKLENVFDRFGNLGIRQVTDENRVDAVTAPSRPYDPGFIFMAGDAPSLPAVSMTQYAAKQYTKWLSLVSGESYRIPTEVEWEYACRAGTTTAYWFGDAPDDLDDYGWFYGNADDMSQPVGQFPANPWGLHDMHGNVAEWTLDAHTENGYADWKNGPQTSKSAVHWPTSLYPRVVRGGSWWHDPEDCRAAKRIASDRDSWQEYDPMLPRSPYWLGSEAGTYVGMRVLRVPGKLTLPQRSQVWEADTLEVGRSVKLYIDNEGRGERGIVDKDLPNAIKNLPPEE